MFKLRYSDAVAAVWDSLPAEVSEELALALADICEDPYAATEPYQGDDKVRRILTLPRLAVALLILDAPPIQRVYVRAITFLG